VFAAALYPTLSATGQMRLLILVTTVAAATLSFRLVEQPGRRIGKDVHLRGRGRNLAAATAGGCVLVVAFVGLMSAVGREGPVLAPIQVRAIVQPRTRVTAAPASSYAQALGSWQRVIRAGLRLRELPRSLRPLAPHLSAAFPPPCIRGLRGVSSAECVVGNPAAPHVAVLNGDSHAEMLRNAVWRAFDPRTWSIHIFARDGCGWAGSLERGPLSEATCARLQALAMRRIRTLRPDVLLLSEHMVTAPFRSRADIASGLAAFSRAAAKTIVLGHTPLPSPWASCLVGVDITRCFTALDATFRRDRDVERQLAVRAGATFVDTSAWLCVRAGAEALCPPVISGVPAFKDETHISAEYQLKLVPLVRALLLSSGVK